MDLNKTCSNDNSPLSKIDQLIDVISRHKLSSFMNIFSIYNQIRMALEDEENTTFMIEKGIYYYKVIPFYLKNARLTYQ